MSWPARLPARLPLVLFAVLAVATVGAFYLTQHLKVQNPLINGVPRTDPSSINPRDSGICTDLTGQRTSFKTTRIGFYLQSRSDNVSVYVINADDQTVATMGGSGQYMAVAKDPTRPIYSYFTWNGRTSDGAYAPAGVYTFRALLQHEGRTVTVPGVKLHVLSTPPRPRISSVTISGSAAAAATATGTTATTAAAAPATGVTPTLTPGHQHVTVHFTVSGRPMAVHALIYRAQPNPARALTLVGSFTVNPAHRSFIWGGVIDGRRVPAGSYLIGVSVTDRSCTTGTFPTTLHPARHSTAGAGVNVSYLSAQAPSTPVPAGQAASIDIGAAGATYHWTLQLAGGSRVLAHGSSAAATLKVRMPGVGLYDLAVTAAGRRASVPVVASAVGARAAAPVLVVLPTLSWQGANVSDDDGDGLPDTLSSPGDSQVSLQRPYVDGLPAGFTDEADLLRFLIVSGFSYDLTTDVALADGAGPSLTGRHGVLLDGTFTWLPTQLAGRLRSFVSAGGGLFADGVHSLQAEAPITDGTYGPIAGPARTLAVDPFGIRHGKLAASDGEIITSLQKDTLGIFTGVDALQYAHYQVLTPLGGQVSAVAGVADAAPTVVGIPLNRGTVVEAGLPDFGVALNRDPESSQLLSNVWHDVLK